MTIVSMFRIESNGGVESVSWTSNKKGSNKIQMFPFMGVEKEIG